MIKIFGERGTGKTTKLIEISAQKHKSKFLFSCNKTS